MAKKQKQEDVPAGSPAWMATFSDLMNLLLCFFVLLFSMSSTDAQKYADVAKSLSESFNNTVSIFENQKQDSVVDLQAFPKNVQQVNNFEEYEEDTTEQDSKQQNSDTEINAQKIAKDLNEGAARELYENVSQYLEKGQIEDKIDVAMDDNFLYVKLSISGSLLFTSGRAEIKEDSEILLDRIGDILKNYQENLIKIEGHTDNVPITKSKLYADNMELSYARAYEVWKYMVKKKGLDPKKLEASGRSQYDPLMN